MPSANHYDLNGNAKGEVELPKVFGAKPNPHVVWEAVRAYLASQRQGNAATKTRSFVSGGGRKPWRQKGTGRARQGSTRANQWRGGYTAFGPQPRDYHHRLPKKMRRLALTSALSQRALEGNVAVVDEIDLEKPRTRDMMELVSHLGFGDKKVCLVTKGSNRNVVLSARNLPRMSVLPHDGMNVYDLVHAEVLLFTDGALDGIKEAYGE